MWTVFHLEPWDSMPNRSKSTPFSWVSLERIHILRQFHRKNQSISKRNYWKRSKGTYTVLSSSSLTFWDLFRKTLRADLAKFILSLHSCGDFTLTSPAYLSQSTSPHVWHNNIADIWADLKADVYFIYLTALAPGRNILYLWIIKHNNKTQILDITDIIPHVHYGLLFLQPLSFDRLRPSKEGINPWQWRYLASLAPDLPRSRKLLSKGIKDSQWNVYSSVSPAV